MEELWGRSDEALAPAKELQARGLQKWHEMPARESAT